LGQVVREIIVPFDEKGRRPIQRSQGRVTLPDPRGEEASCFAADRLSND
jgi:hypothetical protein